MLFLTFNLRNYYKWFQLRRLQHIDQLQKTPITMFEFWESKLRFGGFLKWWYPKTMGFPTQNDDFGLFWGYQKHLLPLRASCQRWHSFRLPVWEILMIYNMIQRWYINVNDTFIHVYLIIYNTYIYNMYVYIHNQDESSASWPLSITPRILQDVKPAGVDCSYFSWVKPPKVFESKRQIWPKKMDFNMWSASDEESF